MMLLSSPMSGAVSVYLSHQATRAGLARGEWGREGQVVGQGVIRRRELGLW